MALSWLESLFDLLFPPKCPLCGSLVKKNGTLCVSCQGELPWARASVSLDGGAGTLRCATPFFYEGRLRDGFLRYKFEGKRDYAALFGPFLAQAAAEQLDGDWDLITWAPLSKQRLRRRGYDQAKLLAEQVSRQFGIPLQATLWKGKHTRPQSTLGAEARAENVKGVYALAHGASVQGKRILLVDDITTTGSTLGACAEVLLEGGARTVDCVALARGRDGGKFPVEKNR